MPKLQDLQPEIDSGMTAKLFLAHNHPGNAEGREVTIYIFKNQVRNGYCRNLVFKGEALSEKPCNLNTWGQIILDKNGIEMTSDAWMLLD